MQDVELPDDTVAVGDLFKLGGSNGGRKSWNLRRFYLAGIYLSYYNRQGKKKGQWDIRGCEVKKTTPEECKMGDAIFAFCLIGPNKYYVMCASNEKSRAVWIRCISDQIEEFKVEVRMHLRRGENVIANEIVKKKGMVMSQLMRIVVTNFPKLMLIDPKTNILKDQRSWTPETQPLFTMISESKFKLLVNDKELYLEDTERGAAFWESLFRHVVDCDVFVEQPNTPEVMDLGKVSMNSGGSGTDDGADDDAMNNQLATMEIGDLELSATNIRMLQSALGNVRELVTAISVKIIAIDEELDWELESQDPEAAVVAAAERENRKRELQALKDKVAVISSNLESLVAHSIDVGLVNLDMVPISNVINETSAMLVMLQYDENFGNVAAVTADSTTGIIEGGENGQQQLNNRRASIVPVDEGDDDHNNNDSNNNTADITTASTKSLRSRSPRPGGDENEYTPSEVVITDANFNAEDIHIRPPNWIDVRLKRVTFKELLDILNGVKDDEILDRRMTRIYEVENEMVQEVVTHGRLLNSNMLSVLSTTDYHFLTAPTPQGQIKSDIFEKLIAASVKITLDNFDPETPHQRPHGWQAVKLYRVRMKEQAERMKGVIESVIETAHDGKVEEEEVLMLKEVQETGVVNTESVAQNVTTEVQKERQLLRAAVIAAAEDAKTKSNHAASSTADGTRSESPVHQAKHNQMASNSSSNNLVVSSFISAAGSCMDSLSEQVLGVVESASSGADGDKKRHSTPFSATDTSSSATTTATSVTAMLSADQQRALQPKLDLIAARQELKKTVTLQDDLKKLKFTFENFDALDASKRPPGWQQVRLKRVLQREAADRFAGMDEKEIIARRKSLEHEEEMNMLLELSVSDRIHKINQKLTTPVFPKTYQQTHTQNKINRLSVFTPRLTGTTTNNNNSASSPVNTAGSPNNNSSSNTSALPPTRTTPSMAASSIAVKMNPLAKLAFAASSVKKHDSISNSGSNAAVGLAGLSDSARTITEEETNQEDIVVKEEDVSKKEQQIVEGGKSTRQKESQNVDF